MFKPVKFLVFFAILPVLSGCIADRQLSGFGLGSDVDQLGTASGREIFRAFDGGVLPKSHYNKLSQKDKTRAILAEYRALELSATGQGVSWASTETENSGTVTAAQPFQVGAENCRQYSHKAVIDNEMIEASGAACRRPNGKWVPLR